MPMNLKPSLLCFPCPSVPPSQEAEWTTDKKDLLKPLLQELLSQDPTLTTQPQLDTAVHGLLDRMHMPKGDNRVAVAKVKRLGDG